MVCVLAGKLFLLNYSQKLASNKKSGYGRDGAPRRAIAERRRMRRPLARAVLVFRAQAFPVFHAAFLRLIIACRFVPPASERACAPKRTHWRTVFRGATARRRGRGHRSAMSLP